MDLGVLEDVDLGVPVVVVQVVLLDVPQDAMDVLVVVEDVVEAALLAVNQDVVHLVVDARVHVLVAVAEAVAIVALVRVDLGVQDHVVLDVHRAVLDVMEVVMAVAVVEVTVDLLAVEYVL